MNSKKNQILLGVIIMILGFIALLRPSITGIFQFSSLIFLAAGLAFLLLYRTKRKSWSLILGGYLTYFGAANFLSPIIGHQAVLGVVGAMFFIVPGCIFLVLYSDKNKRGLLLPACVMLWFGMYLFLKDLPLVNSLDASGVFFLCIGAAFFMAYLMGRMMIGKWALYLGCLFIIFGFFRILRISSIQSPLGNFSQFAAIALIVVSIVIIVRAVRKK